MLFRTTANLVCLLLVLIAATSTSALQLEYNQYNNAVGPLFSDSPVDNTVVSGFTVSITANRNTVDTLFVQNSFQGSAVYNPTVGILTVTFDNDIQITSAVQVLKNVYFRTTSDDDRTRTILYQWAYPFNNNRAYLFADNGHYYEYNSNFGGTFPQAVAFCSARTILGRQGYVYTPNSYAEHYYMSHTLNGQGWAGATDAGHEGLWTYNSGPEFGQTITYTQWAPGEPNNYLASNGAREEQLQIYGGGNYNDLWGTSGLGGLVCEYGGLSGDTPTATPVYNYAPTTIRYVGSPNPAYLGIAATCSVSADVLNSLSYTKYYCPSYSCGSAVNVVGSNPYLYSSTLCQAAQHAGIPVGQSFYIVHLSIRESILPASNQNNIQSSSTSSGLSYNQYRIESADTPNPIPSTPYAPYLQCHSINFFVEEGKPLTGNLQLPSNINNNFNDILYAELPNAQPAAAANCYGGNLVFQILNGPQKHTDTTGTAYTPAYGPFTLNADGTFTYIHLPTKADPTVWNGDDGFTFKVTCTGTGAVCPELRANINVVPTSAASQNAPPVPFTNGYSDGVKCTGTCATKTDDGMWLARQTLPRLWDMQRDETGAYVKNTVVFGGETKATDALDFEWTSNAALISTYSAISNMAARFPTFEVVEWQVDQTFTTLDLNPSVALLSTGFDQNCLQHQGFSGQGSDVWVFNTNQQDGVLGPKYGSGKSWYQKFGGKHSNCDIFTGLETTPDLVTVRKSCRYAPLYSPRPSQDENQAGVWRVDINGCAARWQGKFTWNAMKAQTLRNGNKAWNIAQGTNGGDYTITANIYSQAVQPNSWTQPSRGFVETDTKYLLTVKLSSDTNFAFQMGIDIFTVDLQQFRYFNNNQHSFGYNMIVYPQKLNPLQQAAPDRRITGFVWAEHYWTAPSLAQCPGCGVIGRPGTPCTYSTPTLNDFVAAMPNGNCASGAGVVYLFKGPSTTNADCTTTDPMIVKNVPGISPAGVSAAGCKTTFQNVTLRGTAVGSTATVSETNGFGFEGKITLTFQLANGENPHFVIEPKIYVKSMSVNGAFSGSSSTCRGSPYWPVPDSMDSSLPN
eukprot:PhF_6_TR6213/c0_g1_i1/m.9359